MAALKLEISQQAAVAAQKHKFNQGSAHPTGDASPRRLASGLAATAQVNSLQSWWYASRCCCGSAAWTGNVFTGALICFPPAIIEPCSAMHCRLHDPGQTTTYHELMSAFRTLLPYIFPLASMLQFVNCAV